MQIVRIGIDLAKYVFKVHCVDAHGKAVLRKTHRRDAVPCQPATMPCRDGSLQRSVLLGASAHRSGPSGAADQSQFVKPWVKSNKNDMNDAEAICEAVGPPSIRFVPPKSTEQLAIQAVLRIWRRPVSDRVRLVNQAHGLLVEQGFVIPLDVEEDFEVPPSNCSRMAEDGEMGTSSLLDAKTHRGSRRSESKLIKKPDLRQQL